MDDIIRYVPAASAAISAISVAVTATFAVMGLRAWRAQMTGKRRFEVAELALQAFEEAKTALSYSRNGFSWGGEGETRPQDENETPEQKRHRNSLYTAAERLNNAEDKFTELRKAWVLFEIHFPDGPVNAIKDVFDVRAQVYMGVRQLLDATRRHELERGDYGEDDRRRMANARAAIYNGLIEDDPLTMKMAAADKSLREFCRTHIG